MGRQIPMYWQRHPPAPLQQGVRDEAVGVELVCFPVGSFFSQYYFMSNWCLASWPSGRRPPLSTLGDRSERG